MAADAVAEKTKIYEVIVNGRTKIVTTDELSFEQVDNWRLTRSLAVRTGSSPSPTAADMGTSRRAPSSPARASGSRTG